MRFTTKWLNFTLLVINLIVLVCILCVTTEGEVLVSMLKNKIDILEQQRSEEVFRLKAETERILGLTFSTIDSQIVLIEEINAVIADMAKISAMKDKIHEQDLIEIKHRLETNIAKQKDSMRKLAENVELIQVEQDSLVKNLSTRHSIDVENIEDIIDANLIIRNKDAYVKGSGTHVKINNKSYVLTCAHLVDTELDNIVGVDNDGNSYPLILAKINIEKDLALFEVKGLEDAPYLEISDEAPKAGSEVLVVGNPEALEDIITEGIVAKVEKRGYTITNLVYFGNSGGAVLYKGKVVGVTQRIQVLCNLDVFPVIVNYGYSCSLETIQNFLKGV